MKKIAWMLGVAVVTKAGFSFADAPQAPVEFRYFDQVCVDDHAKQCVARMSKINRPQNGNGQFVACPPGYYLPQQNNNQYPTCDLALRKPEDAEIVASVYEACEFEARQNYGSECTKSVHIEALITSYRNDIRLLLVQFCKAENPLNLSKCDALFNLSPPAVQ